MKRALLAGAVLASACGKFETESIVLDLRVLAIKTQIDDPASGKPTNEADLVIDVDMNHLDLGSLRDQLRDVDVTALVSDPGKRRVLRYTWTLCLADDDGRCIAGEPHKQFADSDTQEDPDTSAFAEYPHATLPLSVDEATAITALSMIQSDIQKNPVDALGGVDLDLVLQIGGIDEDPVNDVYAVKKLRIAPRIPAGRLPNQNPSITHLDGSLTTATRSSVETEVIQTNENDSRCGAMPLESATAVMDPGDVITLFPQASSSVETYVTPGLDGSTIMLTETLSFQWLSTRGSWSDETTGGGHDILGNQSLLGSDWKSPNVNGTDIVPVQIWMIERDERLGVNWLETCIYARPASP
ncbi:MAG TPA: hypothetical protein VGM90_38255 [Kofleriaceae bacterium]